MAVVRSYRRGVGEGRARAADAVEPRAEHERDGQVGRPEQEVVVVAQTFGSTIVGAVRGRRERPRRSLGVRLGASAARGFGNI